MLQPEGRQTGEFSPTGGGSHLVLFLPSTVWTRPTTRRTPGLGLNVNLVRKHPE